MGAMNILWLVAMGLVFVVWAFVMFQTLAGLAAISLRRKAERNAGYFGWVAISLGVYAEFLSSAEHKTRRRRVILLTVLLFAIIILRVVTIGTVEGS